MITVNKRAIHPETKPPAKVEPLKEAKRVSLKPKIETSPLQKFLRSFTILVLVVMIIILIIASLNLITKKKPPVFCDSYGSKKQKDCKPCPDHGTCRDGELKVRLIKARI